MPRVSTAYRDARRARILEAARVSFMQHGFHATSMQDLFASSGMSAGSVYSYFSSKDELILAIAEDNMREVIARFGALARRNGEDSVGDLLSEGLDLIYAQHLRTGLAGLAVQVWAEALQSERLRGQLKALFERLIDDLAVAMRDRGIDAGGADALAGALVSVIPGFLLQLAIRGEAAVVDIPRAVRLLGTFARR